MLDKTLNALILLAFVVVAAWLNRDEWPAVQEWLRPKDPASLHLERQMMPLEQSGRAKDQTGTP